MRVLPSAYRHCGPNYAVKAQTKNSHLLSAVNEPRLEMFWAAHIANARAPGPCACRSIRHLGLSGDMFGDPGKAKSPQAATRAAADMSK
ncbi:MAG: hypothetical protein JWO91_2778 [Acidobacteriaceae bacterium]|nr:hypothetical protein [Acidobacteriaceae bacterium]